MKLGSGHRTTPVSYSASQLRCPEYSGLRDKRRGCADQFGEKWAPNTGQDKQEKVSSASAEMHELGAQATHLQDQQLG